MSSLVFVGAAAKCMGNYMCFKIITVMLEQGKFLLHRRVIMRVPAERGYLWGRDEAQIMILRMIQGVQET